MSGVILITGATSGIGRAAARRFAGAGWKVIATGRRQERLDELVAELGADRVHAAPFDMRDEAAIDAALDALPEGFRDIDVLINNAGLALGTATAQEADLAQWRQMIDTNITGLVTLTHRLRADLHGTGVRVTSIEPGMAETEFTLVRTGGDQAASDALYGGAAPMTGEDIAETLFWVATLPAHLNINALELMPVSQSFAGFQVARD